jgi:UDP-3-O-[3-hydroxymyristoyl] N-acetylglucosamine deacetylase
MVVDTSLATVIGYDGFIVSTIEHLMSTFTGLSIDNALVEVDSYEMPIMDGSAGIFTSLIMEKGIKEQDAGRCFFVIKEPIELREGRKSVGIYPASSFKITCDIDYDHHLVQKQSYTVELSEDVFRREICRARTFGFFHEYEELKRFGLGLGCSMDNVVVIGEDKILNKNGLRYKDEFVRHKLLDCIGDFALIGMPILAHVRIHRSGHFFNHAFLKKIFAQKESWETKVMGNETGA